MDIRPHTDGLGPRLVPNSYPPPPQIVQLSCQTGERPYKLNHDLHVFQQSLTPSKTVQRVCMPACEDHNPITFESYLGNIRGCSSLR